VTGCASFSLPPRAVQRPTPVHPGAPSSRTSPIATSSIQIVRAASAFYDSHPESMREKAGASQINDHAGLE
jgi:hypothetical protein